MGRDKAGLIIEGEPLWHRQLATLRAVDCGELFISGKTDGPYARAGVEIVPDAPPGCGPLGGLSSALRHARGEHLLVLAIDLPAITAAFLRELIAHVQPGVGVVCANEDYFEPLAAIYPRTCLPTVEECLCGDDHSMQHFVRLAVSRGQLAIRVLRPGETPLFRNLNTPEDC